MLKHLNIKTLLLIVGLTLFSFNAFSADNFKTILDQRAKAAGLDNLRMSDSDYLDKYKEYVAIFNQLAKEQPELYKQFQTNSDKEAKVISEQVKQQAKDELIKINQEYANSDRGKFDIDTNAEFANEHLKEAERLNAKGDTEGAKKQLKLANEAMKKSEKLKAEAEGKTFDESVTYYGDDVLNKTNGGKANESNSSSDRDVFAAITEKALTTLSDLRYLVYIIAGFGLVVFSYGAIFGKISFKHLANLAFGLFLVAVMSPFIEYFTGSKPGASLGYGNFLSVNYDKIAPDGDFQSKDCIKDAKGECTKAAATDVKKTSLKDAVKLTASAMKGFDIKKPLSQESLGAISASMGAMADATRKEQADKYADAQARKKYGINDFIGSFEKGVSLVTGVGTMAMGAMSLYKSGATAAKDLASAAKGITKGGSIGDMIENGTNGMRAFTSLSSVGTAAYLGFGGDVARISNDAQDMFANDYVRGINSDTRMNKGESTNAVAAAVKKSQKDNEKAIMERNKRDADIIDKANRIDTGMGALNNFMSSAKKKF